jgi:hypothetical protein
MYAESKKFLDKIRNRDEMMFRMAISHLMDVGIRHLTEENIGETCKKLAERDDTKAFMTNGYMCELIKTAGELTKIPHTELLVYIQREVEYDVFDGGISYSRLMKLLKSCLCWISEDHLETFDIFRCIGLEEEEIELLGYGYLLDLKEEEYDD